VACTAAIYGTLGGVSHCVWYVVFHKLLWIRTLRQYEALRYPYLLAFEPTFVEIRHVETGQLTQIIQGNNLRCLFADTPPSNPNLPHNVHNSYSSPQSPYGMPQQYGDRNSLYNQYGGAPQYPANVGYGSGGYSAGRDEIIIVSDDSVVALRLAVPMDAASMVSR
jgi:RHO1 GDP-GTP exchange protein 1/2